MEIVRVLINTLEGSSEFLRAFLAPGIATKDHILGPLMEFPEVRLKNRTSITNIIVGHL